MSHIATNHSLIETLIDTESETESGVVFLNLCSILANQFVEQHVLTRPINELI